MAKSPFIRRNSAFGSIREASSCKVQPDANADGKNRKEGIDVDALRAISRIVVSIHERLAAGEIAGEGTRDGGRDSSETAGANSSPNT